MKLEKSTIIQRVRTIMDELSANDSEFDSGKDELELDDIIAQKALEALNFVNGNAALNLLEPDVFASSAISSSSDYSFTSVEIAGQTVGQFTVAHGFLRMVSAGYEHWVRMISEPIYETDKEAAKLRNQYTTGTPDRPVVLIKKNYNGISNRTYDKTVVQLFSKGLIDDDEEYTAFMSYMKFVDTWSNAGGTGDPDFISVSQNLSDAYIYYLTGLVLTTLDDTRQQSMYDQAALLMGIHKQATEG